MNNGDDTAYYLSRGHRVVAIEANPMLAKEGAKRFAPEVAAGRLKILNVGVSDREGEFPFWICETLSEWSSFNREIASRDGSPHHEIPIPCQRFSTIMAEHGVPFYLKIDIEGNDMLCLRDLHGADLPKYVSLEAAIADPIDHFVGLGYTAFKCISQQNFLPLEMPPCAAQLRLEETLRRLYSRNIFMRIWRLLGAKRRWTRRLDESRTLDGWRFPFGSSGPFGDQLPGHWQTADEMRATYRAFQELIAKGAPSIFWNEKEYSFWVDLHARRDD
jgi:FkbM family methyltransferase